MIVVSSLCVVEGQGTRQGVVFFYQQPQLLGTKALLLRDHVTACVCVCLFHPCHVIPAQGRVWEVLSRCERFLPPRHIVSMQAGRGDRWMNGDRQRARGTSPATFTFSVVLASLWIFKEQTAKNAISLCDSSTFLWQGKFVRFNSFYIHCWLEFCGFVSGWLCCLVTVNCYWHV